jgi:hypothetical protein
MSEEKKDLQSEEIKTIISETIKELHANEAQLQFKKPTTIQGWFYISVAFCSIVGIIWSSIIFLNNVATHNKVPYHKGTPELIAKMTESHSAHATSQELHHTEEHLNVQMHEEVAPIKEKLITIQTNQATIQANQANFRGDVQDIKSDVRRVQQSIDGIADELRRGN